MHDYNTTAYNVTEEEWCVEHEVTHTGGSRVEYVHYDRRAVDWTYCIRISIVLGLEYD
jgi:hypothetical protein